MSLAVLADHMASKGRGPDSMLIHMSPREVQGLQALAENHGGSLTINPETGLPEAGFLDKLLPTIIGAGISYFTGMDPMTAAAMVGGVETVRTGDIGKGIQAGLGAYGGASLTAGMTGAGSTAMANEAGALAGADAAAYGAAQLTDAGANIYSQAQLDALKRAAIDEGALQQGMSEITGKTTTGELLSKGAESAAKNPMQYLKANAMPLAAAFGPAIFAGQNAQNNMPKTTTGMIRPYSFDPYSGTYTSGNPYQATPTRGAEGGLMGMNNGGYSPGQLDFTQRSEPIVRMAGGGIAGYAPGGAIYDWFASGAGKDDAAIAAQMRAQNWTPAQVAEATGTMDQLADYENRFAAQNTKWNSALGAFTNETNPVNTAVTSTAATNNAAAAAPTYTSYTNEQIGKYLTDNPTADIAAATKTTNADPAAVNAYIASLTSPFKGSTVDERGSGTFGIYNQMKAQGINPDEYYAAATANDPNYAGWSKEDIARGYKLDESMYALSDAKKGNVSDTDWAKLMVGSGSWNKPQYSVNDMAQATGLSTREVQARFDLEKAKANPVVTCGPGFKLSADGKTCVPDKVGAVTCGAGYKLSADGKSCVVDTAVVKKDDLVCGPGYKKSIDGKTCVPDTTVITQETQCPTGYHYDLTLKQCVKNTSATQNTTTDVTTPTDISTADKSTLPVGVSGAGITTINPNGTITTRPDIPGIPEGGFTGMTSLRKAYEDGGGSLGVNKNLFAPKTTKEIEDRYKLTGGSKQSYDYLMGKTPYSPKPVTETGEIMKPYGESVLGIPANMSKKMYIFKNGKYEVNPDYAIPTYDKDGKKSSNLTNADVKTFMNTKPSTDVFYTWATTNNLSPEQIATASERPINEISKLFTGAKDLVGEDGKIDQTKLDEKTATDEKANFDADAYLKANPDVQAELDAGKANFGTKDDPAAAAYEHYLRYGKAGGRKYTKKAAGGGLMNMAMARGGMAQQFNLGDYSDGGRLLRGPGDGVSDSIPASIGGKRPARLADGEFVVPARIVSELGNGSTEAGARKLYAMMDRIQSARGGTVGKGRVAKNSRAEKYLPA